MLTCHGWTASFLRAYEISAHVVQSLAGAWKPLAGKKVVIKITMLHFDALCKQQ